MNSIADIPSEALDINDWQFTADDAALIGRASGAIERLDEQVKRSSVGRAWCERVLYREACASQLAQGRLVHEDELIALDAGLRRRAGYPELMETMEMLDAWRTALAGDSSELLRAEQPGVGHSSLPCPAFRRPLMLKGRLGDAGARADVEVDKGKITKWRRGWRETQQLSPVLGSAIVLDLWRELCPIPGQAWRASVLSALVLRARGLTPNLLLPVDIGWAVTKLNMKPGQPRFDRVMGYVRWLEAAALQGQKDLATLGLAYIPLRSALRGRRKHSRLPALAHLFMSVPVVTVPMASRYLGCSAQAVEKMIPQLGSAVRQITEGSRFRAWAVP